MDQIADQFEEIKDSDDSERINDLILELVKAPAIEHLSYIDYFIENSSKSILQNIKINIFYLIGKIGTITTLENKYIIFFLEEYFKSDRWIRNEILGALELIAINLKLPEEANKVLEDALVDDYLSIRINALSILLHYDKLPKLIFKNLIRAINLSSDSQLKKKFSLVIQKFFYSEKDLFNLLNYDDIYRILNKSTIRTILLIFFKSIINLESFREIIINCEWENNYKEIFLKEIYTFEKILLKSIY